jgi:thiol:disulfide interchange protein
LCSREAMISRIGLFFALAVVFAAPSRAGSAAPKNDLKMAWDYTFGGDSAGLDDVLASATAAHKPVLIEFSADWCAACRLLDRNALSSPEVSREAKRFVTVRIDASSDTAWIHVLAERLRIRGLPSVAFVSSHGDYLASPRVLGLIDAPALLAVLQSVR